MDPVYLEESHSSMQVVDPGACGHASGNDRVPESPHRAESQCRRSLDAP